jgi:transposase
MKVFCGIDWSERHHDVALVDQDGTLIAKRRIGESVADFAELLTLLAKAGDSAEEPIPVAIETSRGLLVAALRATGRAIYAINPMAVSRYRERHCVSRKKSDHVDAMTLANILRTDAHAHRRLPADSELACAITVLARAAQDAIWRRTKAVQELRALLREFYPGFLAAFADGSATNLASPQARAILAIAPTPAAGARLSLARIATALRRAGRQRGITTLAAHIQHTLRIAQLRQPALVETPWATRSARCWPPWPPNAPTPSTSAPQPPRPSPNTQITRSSPASPAWPTSPAPECWPKSVTTAPGSPTPARSRPTPARPP